MNFAKRPGSLTKKAPLRVPEEKKKRKLVIQLKRISIRSYTKKRQKKKCQCKNRIGEDIDKKSTTHTIEQAVQWPTGVALNTHTLKGLGPVVRRPISA